MPSSNAWVEPLGWMLIHSVWLLALIVAGAALVMGCLRRRSAAARYVSGCVALTLSLATLPATLMWVVVNHGDTPVAEMSGGDKSRALIDEHRARNAAEIDNVIDAENQAGQAQGLATLATAHAPAEIATVSIGDAARVSPGFDAKAVESAFWQRTESRLRPHLPVVVAVWLVGVMLLSSRPLIGWHSARRLQRVGLSEVSDSLKDMLSRLSARLGLRRAVRLFQSSLVQIPCVVGAFKPVILLPASAISGLSPEQLEALLAHELAHIRRHDFAVNVMQTLVETLLFYHPAIWWLSRKVRQEREYCCDDLAISVCGDAAGYARMLVSVEGLRGRVPQTSVAASGGSLVERVRRLLPSPQEQTRSPWLAGIVVLGTLVVLVGSWQWTVGQVSNLPKEVAAETQAVTNVSAPMTEQVDNLSRQDWPQWGRSSHRNNVAEGRLPIEWDLEKGTNVVWKAELGSSTYSSPIVSGGKVFIGTNNGAALNPAHPKAKDMSCLVCFEQATGKLLWQYASEKLPAGRVHDWPFIGLCSTACADGDRVWVVTNRCEVVCLDADGFRDSDNDGPFRDEATQTDVDADVVWKFDMFGELGVRPLHQSVSSITHADGVLLLNTSNGPDESHVKIPAPNAPNFLALDAKTGRVIWTDNSAGELIVVGGSSCSCSGTSPAVATLGGVTQAIFAGREGWVYGYEFDDLKRGKTTLLWQFDCNPKTSKYFLGGRARRNTLVASPVIADGRVYVATGKNPEFGEGEADLWCIDPTKRGDLSTELVFNKSFENGEKPIPHKPLCACEVGKGDFVRPNPNAGAIWHYSSADRNGNGKVELEESFHCTLGNPVIHDGLLFIADFSGILHCLDSQTGEVQWTHDLLAATWSSCVIADGHILVGDEDGDLAIFKAARTKQPVYGDEPRNFESPIYSTPVVVDGTLFVATRNALVAIRDPKQAEQQVTKNEETRVVVVCGVVVDADGKPVPGAAVREASRARWRALVRPEWMVPGEVSEMRADAQGRFELRLARRWVPGAIIVAELAVRVAGVERPPLLGMQRVSGEHDVRLPVPDLKVVVKESKPIDVFVSDREGKPVAGAQAGVIVTGWPLATGMTNADGRTTIPVPADVVMGNEVESVYAVKPNVGFNFRSFQWRLPRGEVGSVVSHKAEQVVRLELTGIKRVSVKVVEAPGDQPITGLSLYPWSFQKVGDSEIAVETIPDCWATTDANGRFALPRIIPGQQYHLRARTGEDTWQDIGTVTTKTEKTKDIGDLVLPPEKAADATKTAAAESQPAVKTITGRIVDDQDRPVAGARLWWVVTDWIPEGVIVNTASDEQGRFSISTPDVPPPRPSAVNDTLWVLKEGRQLATVPARNGLIVDGKDSGLVIRLEPATDTSFKVVSPDQKPVAGVVVEPLHFRMHMGYGIIPAEARKILSATTDAEGGVRMPSMPRKGFHSVHATSEAFGTQQVGLGSNPTPPAERTIELQPIGRIEGQLKADNPDWIRGVQLGFSTASQRIGTGLEIDGFALVTTDDQGRFVIPAIAVGSLTIYERAKNDSPVLPRLPASRMIVVGITEKLEITLESPVLVRGTIRTQDSDEPVPGAEISVRYGVGHQGEHVLSDADGRYEARVLSGPVYTQVIAHPKEFSNYQQTGSPWAEKISVRADATPFDLPPIRLAPTITLKGKLIDQEGRPVAKVRINGLNGNRRYGFATTNALGEFSAQIPKTIMLEGYQVWLDDDSAPITPTIDRPNPLILRVTVPRAADGATPK